jgi:hypothetical protein
MRFTVPAKCNCEPIARRFAHAAEARTGSGEEPGQAAMICARETE